MVWGAFQYKSSIIIIIIIIIKSFIHGLQCTHTLPYMPKSYFISL